MTMINSAELIPMTYIPEPMARPTPAVAHIPAAVVRPFTRLLRTKITPAPRNPTPLTTCAAIREASASYPSKKPYLETTIIRAAPSATMAWVRIPADLFRFLRSFPIKRPRKAAINIRSRYSICVQI